jgi:hypothetical protein
MKVYGKSHLAFLSFVFCISAQVIAPVTAQASYNDIYSDAYVIPDNSRQKLGQEDISTKGPAYGNPQEVKASALTILTTLGQRNSYENNEEPLTGDADVLQEPHGVAETQEDCSPFEKFVMENLHNDDTGLMDVVVGGAVAAIILAVAASNSYGGLLSVFK